MEDNTQITPSGTPNDGDKTKVIRMDNRQDSDQREAMGSSAAPGNVSQPTAENSAQIPKQSNMSNDDKTIIQSGAGTGGRQSDTSRPTGVNPSTPLDQTQIDGKSSQVSDQRQAHSNPAQPVVQPALASEKTEELKAALNKPEKSGGVSTGAAIGAAAAAGVAGVAIGATYSDQIKEGLSGLGTGGEQGTEDVAGATDEPAAGTEAGTAETADAVPASIVTPAGATAETVGHISVSYTDPSGAAYGIYASDLDNDGKLDFVEADITAVDGSNIHVTASGEGFINMLQQDLTMAMPDDYIDQGGFAIPTSIVDMSTSHQLYDIVPGDTLSDIAAAHNTSIVNLLDLNPGITDPDMIVSGEQLIIPTGDNISNPYEGYDEYLNGVTDVIQIEDMEIVNPDPIIGGSENEILPQFADSGLGEEAIEGQYEEVDWASFDESPVSEDQSEYSELMTNTDFDSYDSETFQLTENYDSLSDSTDAASEFM